MMNILKDTALLLGLLFAAGCSDAMPTERFDAGELTDTNAPLDAFVPHDGSNVADTGPLDASDAGMTDASIDATSDTDTPDTATPCAGVRDEVTGRCWVRLRWVGGSPCPGSYTGLTWSSIDEQQRLMLLIAPLGSGGTSYKRNGATGVWQMPDGSTPGADWAPSYPRGVEPFSYLTTEGLKSYHQAYAWQYCTRDET